ncbi:MAG TPA: TraR/DksA C4-type zinc finger protein [bacterium]|nr:TraR/DksA C4-type zinc finger protein [bacterium]
MESFSKDFIEKQKKLLLAEKDHLNEEIKKLKTYPDYGDVGEDNVEELRDYENNMSIEGQLERLLAKVELALLAIEKGTYGKCSNCQKLIDEGRLEIMPYAQRCVECSNVQD